MPELAQLPSVLWFGVDVAAVLEERGIHCEGVSRGRWRPVSSTPYLPWLMAAPVAVQCGYYIQSVQHGLWVYRFEQWLQWYWVPGPDPGFWRAGWPQPVLERAAIPVEVLRCHVAEWRLVQPPDPGMMPDNLDRPQGFIPDPVFPGPVVEPTTLWDMVRR